MSQPYEDWILKAENDLASSKVLKENLLLDTSVYHAQQCAEKALKGFLVFKGEPVLKKHDLTFLNDKCKSLDPDFSELSDEADILAPYATE
jgi:HEPN domain-containing protein